MKKCDMCGDYREDIKTLASDGNSLDICPDCQEYVFKSVGMPKKLPNEKPNE